MIMLKMILNLQKCIEMYAKEIIGFLEFASKGNGEEKQMNGEKRLAMS